MPRADDWRRLLTEAAWLTPALAVLGWLGQLVHPGHVDALDLARLAALALFVPALAEELVFRAALLPATSSLPRCGLAVAAFILWHPLQLLWFGPDWGAVVLDPWFLAAVAAIGAATTRLYLATGSIWPPTLLHWHVVVAWKALGGPSPWGV